MSGLLHASVRAPRRTVRDSCPLCGSCEAATLVVDGEAEWAHCACGLVFKRLEAGRPEDAAALGHGDAEYFERYARRRRRRVAKSRRQILDALETAPTGRLLDVGCSLGYALEAARSLGLDAAGVDLSAHAVAQCRRLGFDARVGTLESLPFEDASFAVVVLKHVFEHTSEPRRTLAELRRVLVPGGAAFFAVPHLGYRRAVAAPERSRFFRGEAGCAHAVYYTPATLSRLLSEEGFRIEGVHARLVHRRAGALRRIADVAAAPFRVPFRAAAEALGLRKEFWLVASRP